MEPDTSSSEVTKRIGDSTAHKLLGMEPVSAATEAAGDYIGCYKLIEPLGEGGFGTVWRAEQYEPIHREVALKVIKPGMDSREITARFEAERQALAMMEHPNIAGVLDAGTTQNGRPFFAMELVKGTPITEYCDLNQLSIRRRLELFIPVCHAVQHAHQKGILHRDLKPSNILVAEVDGKAVPKVIDFGIAKALHATDEPALHATLARTVEGMFVGTPQYMSPEQAGASADMDTRSDIYTLGVILYELLTGNTPLPREQLRKAAFDEVLRLIREGEPRRPSSRVVPITEAMRQKSAARSTEPSKLTRALRGDLDWITLKALEKERERRYESASALAQDLGRHLSNEPVEAGPPSALYRLRKLVRRNRLAIGAAAAIVVLLIAGIAVSVSQARRAIGAERLANTEKNRAVKAEAAAKSQLAEAARSDRVVAEVDLQAWRDREAFAYLARACEYDPPGSVLAAEKAFMALNRWRHPHPIAIMQARRDKIPGANNSEIWKDAKFHPDGTRIVTFFGKNAEVWDSVNGTLLVTCAAHKDGLTSAEFSPDGTRIVTASNDRTARVWDAANGKTLAILTGHADEVTGACFAADGAHILTRSADKTARIWDVATGKTLGILAGHEGSLSSAEFSPDGSRIVTASEDKTARIWDAASGHELAVLAGHKDFLSAHFSPDGTRVVTPSGDGTARVWDTASGKPLTTLISHGWVLDAQFRADGKRIVTAGELICVWDAASGRKLATLTGHTRDVFRAEFNPNGKSIVTASLDDTARVWDAETGRELATLAGHGGWVLGARFSHDGTRIVTSSQDGTARVWSLPRPAAPQSFLGHGGGVTDAQFSPDGARIVTASTDKTARIWDVASRKVKLQLTGHTDGVTSAQFNSDGTRIVTGSKDKTARVWDAVTGEVLAKIEDSGNEVTHAQFSPDGRRIVTTSNETTARIWDAATGKMLLTLSGHEKVVHDAQFSPDGTRIITASEDKTARVWDAATGQMLLTLAGHERTVHDAQFSPDGTRIVTASPDRTARAWDAATGKMLATYFDNTFTGQLHRVHFSFDGRRMITPLWGAGAGMWDVASGQLLATMGPGKGTEGNDSIVGWSVQDARFSPDGAWIVTSSGDWKARIWRILPPDSGLAPEWFPDFLRYMAQMRIAPTGGMETIQAGEWLALRERLRAVLKSKPADQFDAYLRVLQRWVKVQ